MGDKVMEYTESVDSITIDSPEVQLSKKVYKIVKGYRVVNYLP